MSQQVLDKLKQLQTESSQHLPNSIITGMTRSLTQARYNLMRSQSNPSGGGFIYVPTNGTQSLMQSQNTQSIRKLMTLPAATEDNFTKMLNTELSGGEQYPILTAVLGTAVGVASGGAGLLFTVATTGLSLAQTSQGVLARLGDELWQIEEIGKAASSSFFGGNSTAAVHVGSYFLVDPYRANGQVRSKGWLIHEERTELSL